LKLGRPSARALRLMFSRIMRRLSRFDITPVRRISLKRVVRACTAFFAFSSRNGRRRSSKIIAANSSMSTSAS
jgi:hypothetical protein